MKTINVEDMKFLEELSQKMNTQDKRATSYPLFVVFDKIKVYREDGEERERNSDYDSDGLCERCEKLADDGEELPDDCEQCDESIFHHFDWEDQIQENDGIYFTAEACDEYIQRRKYSFHKPYSYAISSYFSEEMKRVMEIIGKITSDKNTLR